MTEFSAPRRARRIEMPARLRDADTLTDPGYTFACAVPVAATDDRTAEQWARAVFEGAPRPVRWFLLTGWILILRLRLGPRTSAAHVLGWRILSATPAAVTLVTDSPLFTTHLVVEVRDSRAVHATFLRFEHGFGRLLWAITDPIHRLTIRALLTRAARRAPGTQQDSAR